MEQAVSRRRWVVAALISSAVPAGVLGAAWLLQAAVLPKPEQGRLIAAQAMSWLAGDRLAGSTFAIGEGRPVRSSCVRTWLPLGDGTVRPAVRLETGGRTRVVAVGPPFRSIGGQPAKRPQGLVLARLALAGCAPVLESLVGGLLRHRSKLLVGRDRVGGEPALTLRIGTKAGRVTVYVAPGNMQPLAVAVDGPELTGRARLRLTRPASLGAEPSGDAA
jgi:hypothetical protein